jgi:ribosomal protein S18 acetylase RimI-like enzyme
VNNQEDFICINPGQDVSAIVKVLNLSHGTIAKDFNFTKEDNPTNNAFIDEKTLKEQLNNGIELYGLKEGDCIVGCIAIEKSKREADTFYIEKVSVLPEFRHKGIGIRLMDFATVKIKDAGGQIISIALIDSNSKLKKWYLSQGFIETGFKDFEHLPFRVCFMRKEIRV